MNSVAAFRPALIAAFGAVTVSLILGTASPAEAATPKQKALGVAEDQKGDWYEWGAAGPNRFDCSGLTLYSFGKAGKKLPHNAQAQYNGSRHLSSPKKGDLVFIGYSSKSIYHVGIYAGNGKMWDAPKPGRTVGLHKVSSYTAGSPRAYFGEVR